MSLLLIFSICSQQLGLSFSINYCLTFDFFAIRSLLFAIVNALALEFKIHLTHLSQMEFPTQFGQSIYILRVVGFFIFIQNLIEHSVSKQWRPLSDAMFCTVCQCPIC